MRTRLVIALLACVSLALVARIALDVRAEGPAKPRTTPIDPATALAAMTSVHFGAFGGGGAVQAPQEPPRRVYLAHPINPRVAATWQTLGEPIPMKFSQETPLEDVLKYIKSKTRDEKNDDDHGLAIYLDPIGLQEAEKTPTSPITLALDDVPLSTSLELLLKQLGMKFYVQKDGIVVITSESSEDAPVDAGAEILEQITWMREELTALRTAVHGGASGNEHSLEHTLAEAVAELRQEIQALRKETTAQHRRVNADIPAKK